MACRRSSVKRTIFLKRNNTFQPIGGNLLVRSLSNSHHRGLVVNLLWQLVAWCSRGYPWVAPLLSILEKMERYQLEKIFYLHNMPYSTFHIQYNNNATQVIRVLQPSSIKNHPPSMYFFFHSSLHSPRKVLHIPQKSLMHAFIFSHFLYPPSPHTTHKAHIDPEKIGHLS
jgi:hypothetical protein